MKISVITPSVRPELIEIVARCLKRQAFTDYEWLIGAPNDMYISFDRTIGHDYDFVFVPEPPKREGDYYSLNKCWNSLFKACSGELVVNIVDGLWFEPDLLDRLWTHYEKDPMSCIGAVGDQYDQIVNNKPENRVWVDPRRIGGFHEIPPTDFEMCIASIPMQAVRSVGGIDEEFDKYAALSEKEMCCRIAQLRYKFYLDESLEYRAVQHPRLNEKWDERYFAGQDYYRNCLQKIHSGERRKLDFLDQKDYKKEKVLSEKGGPHI